MNIYAHYEHAIHAIITELANSGQVPAGLDAARLTCEAPRDESHGDLASNAAMVLAKQIGMKPRDLAEIIAERLGRVDGITCVEIAGPGFINMRLDPMIWVARVADILAAGDDWGKSDIGTGHHVNIEYVSANPTGPLHAAHARGAIIGDALAALLEKTGYTVTREYYINDAGAQVDALARSAHLRYLEVLGEEIAVIPAGFYPSEYLVDTGKKFAALHGDAYRHADEAEWLPIIRAFTIDDMMESIKTDLIRLGIKMDRFSSERALVEDGGVDKAMANLADKGLIYEGVLERPKGKTSEDWEPREQTLFKATEYGDDVDRAIKKSDGTWTYFASDVAYHMDKLTRGAERLINIWGADHGGYVKRMQAAVTAISGQPKALDVRLCQLVNLMDKGKPVKMSKRAGNFVALSDVLDTVGKDILRFIMLTRRGDQAMDFDYAKVTEQSRDNPVFYVQYAHARAKSVLRSAAIDADARANADLSLLKDDAEIALIKMMAGYPRFVESTAEAHEPHRIAFYLNDLAASFHALWNKGRDHPELKFIIDGDDAVTAARLQMVDAAALVIRSGLAMLGVDAAEEM